MKKLILFGVIATLLVVSVGVVMGAPLKNPKADVHYCEKEGVYKPAFWQLNTKSGNIHVWNIATDAHAICVPKDRFTEDGLIEKYSEGWYDSSCFEEYICKWSE